MKTNSLFAALLTLALVGAFLPFAPVRLHDFRAFYCAGRAVIMHADPYREHPLHDCERTETAFGVSPGGSEITVPSPLPGYALALFALISRLPFGAALGLWIASSIGALCGTVVLLSRTIAVPPAALAIVLGVPSLLVTIPMGELTPFVLCGLAVCAFGLKRDRLAVVCAGALLTAFNPTVAAVLWLALAIYVPTSRLLLTAAAVGLALVSGTIGVHQNVEYFGSVLPTHAFAAVTDSTQYSTTHIAWIFGVAPAPALAIGKAWYVVMAVIGLWTAGRLRAHLGSAAIVLVPPAFAVAGGVYAHYHALTLALPAFLLVACMLSRPLVFAAVFYAAIPWLTIAAFPPFALALIVLAGCYATALGVPKIANRLAISSAVLACAAFVFALTHATHTPVFVSTTSGNPLADVAWGQYILWADPRPYAVAIGLQIPTVLSFFIGLTSVGYAAWFTANGRFERVFALPEIAPELRL